MYVCGLIKFLKIIIISLVHLGFIPSEMSFSYTIVTGVLLLFFILTAFWKTLKAADHYVWDRLSFDIFI